MAGQLQQLAATDGISTFAVLHRLAALDWGEPLRADARHQVKNEMTAREVFEKNVNCMECWRVGEPGVEALTVLRKGWCSGRSTSGTEEKWTRGVGMDGSVQTADWGAL